MVDAARKLLFRKRFSNLMSEQIVIFFEDSRLTVEATASYEWFVQWVEPLAMRIVLSPNQHRRCSGLIDRRVFQTGMVTRRGYATSGF